MTRKDFELIADALGTVARLVDNMIDTDPETINTLSFGHMSNVLQETNPAFDSARFLDRCRKVRRHGIEKTNS